MAEFTYNLDQTVPYRQPAALNTTIPCNKGYVYHRNGSGIVTLRGIVNNPCARVARYSVKYSTNIALPTGATPGEIGVAIVLNGEAIGTSMGVQTPTTVETFGNVSGFAVIDVPAGCCETIALENISTGETTNPSIIMRNTNVEVKRVA
jgi:hypothetical protein